MILKRLGFLSALALAGCTVNVQTGPTQYESKVIEMEQAVQPVTAALHMGAGEMKIGSGTQKLMQAYFTYNVPSWKPEVRYDNAAGSGNLEVSQPQVHGGLNGRKYEWDLRFSEQVPLDLTVQFGAGHAQLDLGRLNLRGVVVHMGVGQIDMDLRGRPKASYNVEVHGGIGQATVRLPAGVGVEAEAQGGIGHIDMRGLHRDGGRWINDELGKAPVTIKVSVHGGIGEIRVLAEKDE